MIGHPDQRKTCRDLTVEQVAYLCNVAPGTVRGMFARGEVRGHFDAQRGYLIDAAHLSHLLGDVLLRPPLVAEGDRHEWVVPQGVGTPVGDAIKVDCDGHRHLEREIAKLHKELLAERHRAASLARRLAAAETERPKRKNISPALRQRVTERDGFACRYCGRDLHGRPRHLDHLVPFSRGGDNSEDNLVLSCEVCNSRKGTRLPSELEDIGMALRPAPSPGRPTAVPLGA